MGKWSTIIFGDGSFETTNRNFDKRQQSHNVPDAPTQPVEGPVRVWTRRHDYSPTHEGVMVKQHYRFANRREAKVGDVMIDADIGDVAGTHHVWHSFEPGEKLSVPMVEKLLKGEMHRGYHRHRGHTCEPSSALRQFFDERGNFIGKDRNMKFEIDGKADKITVGQFNEMGWDD